MAYSTKPMQTTSYEILLELDFETNHHLSKRRVGEPYPCVVSSADQGEILELVYLIVGSFTSQSKILL